MEDDAEAVMHNKRWLRKNQTVPRIRRLRKQLQKQNLTKRLEKKMLVIQSESKI